MKAQGTFKSLKLDDKLYFGGTLLKGNARIQRPIFLKKALHLVMRSSLAKGSLSFLEKTRAKKIDEIIAKQARRFNIRIYKIANSGNHLHLLLLPPSRQSYVCFIKAVSGLIARLTLKAERNAPKNTKFWDAKPFTRIVHWGEDFNRIKRYLLQNTLEAFGFLPLRNKTKDRKMNLYPRWISMKTLEAFDSG